MSSIDVFITPDIASAFDEVGAVVIRGLLKADQLDLLRAGIGDMIEAADDYSDYYDKGEVTTTDAGAQTAVKAPPKRRQTLTRQNAWQMSAQLRQFLSESPLSAAAAALLKSQDVRLYEDLMIYKAAGSEQPTPWHQDDPQWPLKGRQMCSAWFCLDPVEAASGALRFVSGTHRGPRYRPFVGANRQADLLADSVYFEGGAQPDVDADPARFKVVCFDTQPGDVVFFHPRLLHGAFGSNPVSPRRTFSIRFLGDDVRWEPKRTVMYGWLSRIQLQPGDPVAVDEFPLLWSDGGHLPLQPA